MGHHRAKSTLAWARLIGCIIAPLLVLQHATFAKAAPDASTVTGGTTGAGGTTEVSPAGASSTTTPNSAAASNNNGTSTAAGASTSSVTPPSGASSVTPASTSSSSSSVTATSASAAHTSSTTSSSSAEKATSPAAAGGAKARRKRFEGTNIKSAGVGSNNLRPNPAKGNQQQRKNAAVNPAKNDEIKATPVAKRSPSAWHKLDSNSQKSGKIEMAYEASAKAGTQNGLVPGPKDRMMDIGGNDGNKGSGNNGNQLARNKRSAPPSAAGSSKNKQTNKKKQPNNNKKEQTKQQKNGKLKKRTAGDGQKPNSSSAQQPKDKKDTTNKADDKPKTPKDSGGSKKEKRDVLSQIMRLHTHNRQNSKIIPPVRGAIGPIRHRNVASSNRLLSETPYDRISKRSSLSKQKTRHVKKQAGSAGDSGGSPAEDWPSTDPLPAPEDPRKLSQVSAPTGTETMPMPGNNITEGNVTFSKRYWERLRRQEQEEQELLRKEMEEEKRMDEQRRKIEEAWKRQLEAEKKRRRDLIAERERRERERREQERREEEEYRRKERQRILEEKRRELEEKRRLEKELEEKKEREERMRRERVERERKLEEERRRQEEERLERDRQEKERLQKLKEERIRREKKIKEAKRLKYLEKRRRERAQRLLEERRKLDEMQVKLKEKLLQEKLRMHEKEVRYKQMEKKHIEELMSHGSDIPDISVDSAEIERELALEGPQLETTTGPAAAPAVPSSKFETKQRSAKLPPTSKTPPAMASPGTATAVKSEVSADLKPLQVHQHDKKASVSAEKKARSEESGEAKPAKDLMPSGGVKKVRNFGKDMTNSEEDFESKMAWLIANDVEDGSPGLLLLMRR